VALGIKPKACLTRWWSPIIKWRCGQFHKVRNVGPTRKRELSFWTFRPERLRGNTKVERGRVVGARARPENTAAKKSAQNSKLRGRKLGFRGAMNPMVWVGGGGEVGVGFFDGQRKSVRKKKDGYLAQSGTVGRRTRIREENRRPNWPLWSFDPEKVQKPDRSSAIEVVGTKHSPAFGGSPATPG